MTSLPPTPDELLRQHVTSHNVMEWWDAILDAVCDEEYQQRYQGRHRDPRDL